MPIAPKILDAIEHVAETAGKLNQFGFSGKVVDRIQNLAAVVTYRRFAGPNRLPLIGLIGCAGAGKSTLFNSFCGDTISATGWRVHNTRGPVLFMSETYLAELKILEQRHGRLLMPSIERINDVLPADEQTCGEPGRLQIIAAHESRNRTNTFGLLDLPDINSAPAIDERLVALDAMPWLDYVVFVVDDETVYHRVYEKTVHLANEIEQSRCCVMVNRGRDGIDPEHPDWLRTQAFFGVDKIHVLPDLRQKSGYGNEPGFIALKKELTEYTTDGPNRPIFQKISKLAGNLCRENLKRQKHAAALDKSINQSIRTTLSRQQPLPLNRILAGDTLHTLNHLGLKRFALSNLLYFFKRVASTGALTNSIRLLFGNRRDQVLGHLLQIDRHKLIRQVTKQVQNHSQHLTGVIRRSREFDFLKQVNTNAGSGAGFDDLFSSEPDLSPFITEIENIANDFETTCRELLSSDSVAKVIENDPMAILLLLGALTADVFVVPGFGSWLLVPSVLKYLPMGKFESAKKNFQRAIQNLIRKQIFSSVKKIQSFYYQNILSQTDPLWKALEICSQHAT
ncbi:MAG: hypothetical protein GY874_11875 [Desulfobacteraceae bacterium]|nr:hypothetical protein [Desulfobacteraceae bacterium]